MIRCASPECVESARLAKGVFRGKKRPDHGAKVSERLKGRPKSEEHKRNLKTNTLHFKKKMLENKNIATVGKSDDDINVMWKELHSELRQGRPYKETCVQNWFGIDNAAMLNDETLDGLYRRFSSEKSTLAIARNPNMGKGKRHTLTDLRYHEGSDTITVETHAERRFVLDFLERHQLHYRYEPFAVTLDSGLSYIPDFLVMIDGEPSIVELKGTIYSELLSKIIESCAKTAENYTYYFVQRQYFKMMTLEEFEQFRTSVLTQNELKNIYNRTTTQWH